MGSCFFSEMLIVINQCNTNFKLFQILDLKRRSENSERGAVSCVSGSPVAGPCRVLGRI